MKLSRPEDGRLSLLAFRFTALILSAKEERVISERNVLP